MEKQEKSAIESRKNQILNLIKEFCTQKLDNDYFELSERLLNKLGRKRDVPFMSGKIEIWAAAVIHTLGTINFLFDKSFEPYTTVDEINVFFGTNKSSTGQKSKIIRDLLNLGYFDNEFSTDHMKQNNPFARLTMVNGFIVSKDSLPDLLPKKDSLPKTLPKKEKKKTSHESDDSVLDLFSSE
ncbi:MAG: DUF6398 domain-containing protein [Bacteroidales bacterium]|jgi:hypothetical protein|nr:DUF6398 domain-containing protein [Bacteroidales bacterium]